MKFIHLCYELIEFDLVDDGDLCLGVITKGTESAYWADNIVPLPNVKKISSLVFSKTCG